MKRESEMPEDEGDERAQRSANLAAITQREWEQIEAVSIGTRAVGNLFAFAAARIASGRELVEEHTPWDTERWVCVKERAREVPKGASKRERLRLQMIRKTAEEDKARYSRTALPGFELFGGRTEAYMGAFGYWLRHTNRAADCLVSLHACTEEMCVYNVPPEVMCWLSAQRKKNRACSLSPLELLTTIVENEEQLTNPSFRIPTQLRLHSEQETFVRRVLSSVRSGTPLLLSYRTPPSGGKTSAAALLGAVLACEWGSARGRMCTVVYTCYSLVVRIEVCRHLIAASVPFASVTRRVASPSFRCYESRASRKSAQRPLLRKEALAQLHETLGRCDRKPVVLVCDLTSALCLCKESKDNVLLFDEPTAPLARAEDVERAELVNNSPRCSVLISATISTWDMLENARVSHLLRFPDGDFDTVSSERLGMSVTARDVQGQIWAPHNCGASDFQIAREPHLLRFYSPRVLLSMVSSASAAVSIEEEDIVTYEAIRKACLRLLRAGIKGAEPSLHVESLPWATLSTSSAHRYPGCTLLLSGSASDNFFALLRPLKEEAPSFRRTIKKLTRDAKRNARAAHEEEDAREEGEAGEEVLWPDWAVVNTSAHVKRYAPTPSCFPMALARSGLCIPSGIVQESAVEIVESLLSGIIPLGSSLSDRYCELVCQTLAEGARASYILGGRDLIFGLNLPVDRVVIDIAETDYDTLKQACGRAGRTGKATRAEVVFGTGATLRAALCPSL